MSGGRVLELLAPRGLWLLTLLVPLVVLYILKIRRERRRVPSTWLWASARRNLLARSPFEKLTAQIPLLLEALAIILFALALARPATRGAGITGDHVAIVVDTSASMGAAAKDAKGNATTRIALAKRAAKDVLASLGPGSEALLLEASREARLVSPLDRDLKRVQAAVDGLDARDVEGDLGAAVALAVDRLRLLGGTRRVIVVTDGDLAHPDSLAGAALPLEVVRVGTPIDNAAIVRVDVRAGADGTTGREEVQAFLLLANYGTAPRDLFVTMRERNASDVLASRRVLVQPGERLPVVLTFHPTPGDYDQGLLFDIAPHDALPLDDVAYGKVPAGDKLPVFLAGASPSPWLERALASDPRVTLRKGSVGELMGEASLDIDTLVVVDGACPADPPGADVLIVHPPAGPCGDVKVGDVIERPVLTSWEHGDARLRFLTLDGVHVARANKLEGEGAGQELVRTQAGAIVADASTPARAVTVVGFDVGDSDWPLKASYVLFVRNIVEQARAHRAHGVTGPARAGEPMRVHVPSGAKDLRAVGPKGEAVEVALRGGLAVLPDVPRVGFYELSWKGAHAGSLVVPSNLTSAAESDLTPREIASSKGVTIAGADAAPPEAHTEWSWLLALLALGLLVADVAYLTRAPRTAHAPQAPKKPERRAA